MNKKDEQYNTTHSHIQNCFFEMLEEMSFEKITVTGIAQKSNINRKTFYLHYSSLDALLEECTKRCVNTAYVGIFDAIKNGVTDGKIATRAYAVFEEDKAFWKWLLTEPECDEAVYRCQRLAVQILRDKKGIDYPQLTFKENIPVIFSVVSLWYMLRLWMVWDHENMSLQELDNTMDKLLSKGAIDALKTNLDDLGIK